MFLKIILLPITFGFIFYKLIYAYRFGDLFQEIYFEWSLEAIGIIALNFMLMFINYALETAKWHLLIKQYEGNSYWQSFKGVLAGVALNIITPNQLGDFVGRTMFLTNFDKIRGTLTTVISHTSQVISTIVFGVFGLLWLAPQLHLASEETSHALLLIFSVLTILTIFGYMNIGLLGKLKITKKYADYLDVFQRYSKTELNTLMLYSVLRYVIFVFQYLLFLTLFKVDVTLIQAIACMVSAMFTQSFLPGFILTEIGVRGASALWFFSLFTAQVSQVLLSAYAVWMINLMIPGIIGLYFILKWKKR